MRIAFTVLFACLILALMYCAHIARLSHKAISRYVMYMLLALILPVSGNLLLIASSDGAVSTLGYYIYFIGMDLVMLALLRFTSAYCFLRVPEPLRIGTHVLLMLDALQVLANTVFGHAFDTEEIMTYGAPYFRLLPHLGQTVHRVVDYGILAAVLVIFLIKLIRSPRIEWERYLVIFVTIIFTALWQTLYIFSRTPMDRSMIGFAVFGLLVFYFSLYYRPLRLLDRMLATVASEIPDALFFFDANARCIWVNKRGMELAGIEGGDFEAVPERLESLLGSIGEDGESWSGRHISGSGESVRSYVMERRAVTDERGRRIGFFLNVRDNSDEQKTLQREIYNATHDALTKLYNRAGYDLLLSGLDLSSTLMLLVDVDEFKGINDGRGHEAGDRVLRKIAATMRHYFRGEDYLCRIGGDEFIVLIQRADESLPGQLRERVRAINAALADTEDGLPPVSISVGAARGAEAGSPEELFEHADLALYSAKRGGRSDIRFFEPDMLEQNKDAL